MQDSIHLIANTFQGMNDKNKILLAKQQPDLFKNLVQMLGIQVLTNHIQTLDMIGDLIAISESLCSNLVQD